MSVDLKAIKERLAKATPGPWRVGRGALNDPCAIDAPDPDYPGDDDYGIGVLGGDGNTQPTGGDRELIEHAHADLTALVSEVESLRAEVERLRAEAVAVRDPASGPPSWVEVEVRASSPEQRSRTAAWIRRADKARAVVDAVVEWQRGCSHARRGRPEECPDCTRVFSEVVRERLASALREEQ